MAEKKMNVRSKLAKARLLFLQKNVGKSGKNMHLEFKYFELEDIVPAAVQIFAEVGIVTTTTFDEVKASMTVYDADDPESAGIEFCVPYREMKPIVSNSGKEVTNAMQALGSSVTYLRRYLYMMVLDIVEHDDIDGEIIGKPEKEEEPVVPATPKKETKKSVPKTPKEREEIKKELTSADGNATEEQIAELKAVCKELLTADPSHNDMVTQIAMKTDGFTKIAESACVELVKNIREMVKAYA